MLLQLLRERLLKQPPDLEEDDHSVQVFLPLEKLLHDVRLVEVGPQRDQDLLVDQDELPEFGHLALEVPHQEDRRHGPEATCAPGVFVAGQEDVV